MLMLISLHPRYLNYRNDLPVGMLCTPTIRFQCSEVENYVTAMDNEAFIGFDENRFRNMLQVYKDTNPKFVAVPDVVANHNKTLLNFYKWKDEIESFGYPLGFVCQNGMKPKDIPEEASAIFMGGDNDFKLGSTAIDIIDEAKQKGLWVHIGRVNSKKRIRFAKSVNADSFDGSSYARFVEIKTIPHLEYLKELNNAQILLHDM